MQFLEQTWAGNSILRWMIAVFLVCLIPVAVKAFNIVVTRKGKTDESLRARWVEPIKSVVHKPGASLIRFGFFWIIVHEVLTLPERLRGWLEMGIYFGAVFAVGWIAAGLAEKAIDVYFSGSSDEASAQVDGLLRPLFRRVASILAWLGILLGGLDHAGYDVRAILAGLGIGGLALAMASKDLLTDLLGGVYIMINRPFEVGDKILFKDKWATVLEFGLRTTTLRDFDINHKIIVPNGQFTNNAMVNISDHPGSMILMNIRLSLTNDVDRIAKALELIQEILKAHSEVRYIWSKLDHFDDYAFTLRIHYDVLEFKHRIRVKSEINFAIARAFQTNGIKFAAMPVRHLHDAPADCPFVG